MSRILLSTFLLNILLWQTGIAQQVNADGGAQSNGNMTLDDCLNYAYEYNENLKNAMVEQRIAKADVKVTRAQGLPQIDGSINYKNNFAVPVVYLPAEAGGFVGGGAGGGSTGEEVELRFGIAHESNATLSASQMIFDGSYFVGLQAAETYEELRRKEMVQSKIDVAEQVTKAYYTVMVNDERLKQANSNYLRLDTLLYETKLMFDNGFAEEIEVDRIKVQFNNAKTTRNSIERLAEVSKMMLKFQMGMPLDDEMTIAETISDVDIEENASEVLQYNYDDRIEFRILETNKELTRLDLKNNRVQYLPKLTANASYGYNTGADDLAGVVDFSRWNSLGSFGASLSIPIFDGLRKANTIQKNKLQLQQLSHSSSQLKKSIDLEVLQAQTQLQDNLETLSIQQENLALAQKVYDVAKIKYQEGVGSNIEVVNSENDLLNAETNYYGAVYDALIAKVALEKALGNLIKD